MPSDPKPNSRAVDQEVREKIHLEILKRTGAYLTNDHFLLPSGHHAPEYIEKSLVTTEPTFTEGLGAVIAKNFAPWPVDVVLATGLGALIVADSVARAHPSHPILIYATKGMVGPRRRVTLPREFRKFIAKGTKVLIIEDLITTGETLKLLTRMVTERGGQVAGIGCLWRRDSKVKLSQPIFSLVTRDFPTYLPQDCPLCRQGMPLNEQFARGSGE